MTAPAKDHITTRVSASGKLELTFVGNKPDPHARKIERIRLISGADQRGPAADRQTHAEGAGR